MTDRARVLVVAATARELAAPDGWRGLVCGVGPVDAAAATAAAIAQFTPAAVLHVGIAGARRARAIPPGQLVIGSASQYCDLGVSAEWAPHTMDASSALIAAAQRVLPSAPILCIGTSARVGGSTACDVEAMEGFGVLRAASLAGIPALEVRAISNDIEEADRTKWHCAEAFAAITAVTSALVDEMVQCVN